MYEGSIRDEFTHQTDTFARAPAMTSATALGTIVDLVPEDPSARWLEVACGPPPSVAPWRGGSARSMAST